MRKNQTDAITTRGLIYKNGSGKILSIWHFYNFFLSQTEMEIQKVFIL